MKASQSMEGDGGATQAVLLAFATEAGKVSGTVETIAAHLLTFECEAIRTLQRRV